MKGLLVKDFKLMMLQRNFFLLILVIVIGMMAFTDDVVFLSLIHIQMCIRDRSIVLYNKVGKAYLGLPNIDNRGRAWMAEIEDRTFIYEKTGRWVTEDFPAAKLMGYRKKYPEEFAGIAKITSLSEWIGEMFTGKLVKMCIRDRVIMIIF